MSIYTEEELQLLSLRYKASPGITYISVTGNTYVGQRDGSLRFVTENFDSKAQNAVGNILVSSESSENEYDPDIPEITTNVNQMNLSDIMAFAAAHG